MVSALIVAGLVATLVAGGRFLLRARRAILELHHEITATARLIAQINVDLAREHFLHDNLAAAARFDARHQAGNPRRVARPAPGVASARQPVPWIRSTTTTACRTRSS